MADLDWNLYKDLQRKLSATEIDASALRASMAAIKIACEGIDLRASVSAAHKIATQALEKKP